MAGYKRIPDLILENVEIMGSSKEGFDSDRFGGKQVCLWIDDVELAQQLSNDGWDIHISRPTEDFPDPRHFLPVNLKYDFKNPEYAEDLASRVFMVEQGWRRNRKVSLDANTVSILAKKRIVSIDATIRGRWSQKKSGEDYIKAYVATMYVTVEGNRDPFAQKYAEEEAPEDE